MSEMQPLLGKRAIVIGGSRGIGAAIARRLAAEGASVALTYSASPAAAADVVAEIEAAGGVAFALAADSGDVTALQTAIAQAAKRLRGLDILVNNAGVMAANLLDLFSVADFDRVMNVNVRAAYFAVQEAARHMTTGGRIVIIGSNTAVRSAFPGSSVYALSKAAVAGMTRTLAHELAPLGITINNLQPGPTITDLNPADGPHAAYINAALPVGRMAEASEIASFVAYLAGGEAGFVTGASLTVDGGMTA